MNRQPLGQAWLHSRIAFTLLLAATVVRATPLSAQADAILPLIGGFGGGQFIARCPEGHLLAGLKLRTGSDVDAVGPICVTAYGPADTGPAEPYATTYFGGGGGTPRDLMCSAKAPIITGIYVRSQGRRAQLVNQIHVFCGLAAASQAQSEFPSVVFDGAFNAWEGRSYNGSIPTGVERCPAGMVAVGVHGKYGDFVDAMGLICGPPVFRDVVKAAARGSAAASSSPSVSICEAAREARSRNSPAAPGLEAQCRAAGPRGEKAPVRAVAGSGAPTGPAPKICDAAREARARNSPAASGLEAQCRATTVDPGPVPALGSVLGLAPRGEALAYEDPLASRLRDQQSDDGTRRGFDIGMAAAEGQTLPGPSKQRIRDVLTPEEKKGFDLGVEYSLERNRNADLAKKGAAIAVADSVVAEAREIDNDAFYQLGFDIATALFGDPALGAEGRTQTGPNSLKIRDSLSAAGQRGFNASVALHLSRSYR